MKFNIGDKFGKYVLKKQIGKGGNAYVWKVTDGKKEYAMKLLIKSNSFFDKKYNRFKDEIKVVMKNQDVGGIIPIFDYNIPDKVSKTDQPWYIMPIAEPISNCFNDSTNIKDIVLCIKELAERLSLLHEKGIVHRDIKPSNLYIYHDTWCFGDFGLVDYPEKSDITDKKESVGPKWTMAPEMKRDAVNADGKKADVYSLAKTLWILLTHVTEGFDGQYDDSSPKIRLRSFLRYEYIVDIEILLRNATDNTPESRPSIQQFINVLDKWIQNSEEFKKSNLMEWNYIQKKLFKSLAPMRTEWDSKEAIVEIMNIISNTPNLNHMFLPDGGGMDLEHAIMSSNYTNCIELSCGPMEYIINPKRLIYQNISNNPDWSYFRLEVNNIEPSYIFDVEYYNEHSEEEIIDLGNSNFIHPKYWTYRHYDDKPLPKDSRLIIRV
ncbi:MAG: protein kinase [Sedimentibacter saalensis]|jgi:serine/threonine-protein kinase|uniref:protein kinase domain-containing protein n=1 Tax=Sedimentibacter saalensis TaxID=130788 RepID=UPI002B2113E2|nr:protein kinase [Sedimentibacter saalensis]MEA5096225.1 protein kinase [Sedimentibacter saalensis]